MDHPHRRHLPLPRIFHRSRIPHAAVESLEGSGVRCQPQCRSGRSLSYFSRGAPYVSKEISAHRSKTARQYRQRVEGIKAAHNTCGEIQNCSSLESSNRPQTGACRLICRWSTAQYGGSRGMLEEGAGNAMEGQEIERNTFHSMAIVSRAKTKYSPFRKERPLGAGGTSSQRGRDQDAEGATPRARTKGA
jgi:hypothetical protein